MFEFFPENNNQAKSIDLKIAIMTEEMGKHMRLEYTVRTYLIYNTENDRINNHETLVSHGGSFDGENDLKAFDVIRIRRNKREDKIDKIIFKETHKLDHEYLNIRYLDPKEEKKRQEFAKIKETLGGV
jgi:hypothetical protein